MISLSIWNFIRLQIQHLRSSANLTFWLILRALSQAVMTVAIARQLGPHAYGHFVAYIAIGSLLIPVASLGLGTTILTKGNSDPASLPGMIYHTKHLWAMGSLFCGLLGALISVTYLPNRAYPYLAALLLMTEIGSSSYVEIISRIEQTRQTPSKLGLIFSGLAITRMMASLIYLCLSLSTLNSWIALYIASSLGFCIWLASFANNRYPSHKNDQRKLSLIIESIPYNLSSFALRFNGEFNKPLLAKIDSSTAGLLNVSQRIIDVASIPLNALTEVLLPKIFKNPDTNKTTITTLILIAITTSGAIWMSAPLLVRILGNGYSDSTPTIRLLSFTPLLFATRTAMSTVLINHGLQRTITTTFLMTLPICAIANTTLITRYGINGSIASTYITEISISGFLYFFILRNMRRTRPQHP